MRLKPEDINIGDMIFHKDKGEIIVLGIAPHCGDYCVTIYSGWVYLKHCSAFNEVCRFVGPDGDFMPSK